jgi:hypothetical protein
VRRYRCKSAAGPILVHHAAEVNKLADCKNCRAGVSARGVSARN